MEQNEYDLDGSKQVSLGFDERFHLLVYDLANTVSR
jgi:hypothetical protein